MALKIEVVEKIRAILRRDLKLGADAPLAADVPLFGSDHDLDSLDMLLLVASIEREFGIKIPSEAMGKEVFQSINTLAQYIETHSGSAGAGANPSQPRKIDPLSYLPHADPFRFVSRVTSFKENNSAEGVWEISGQEYFFAGHFPGQPVVPGVLIVEALAQLSGLVAARGATAGKLAHVDFRFEHPVVPPAEIVLKSKVAGEVGALRQFEVLAEANGVVVARGTLALHYTN